MNSKGRPRVLLADDHRLVAEALKSLLSVDFDLVGVVTDGRSLLIAARQLNPDVIVADISMPHLNGLDALDLLKREHPGVKVVFLTMHQEVAYARRALESGAAGFVLKHSAPTELVAAIQAALNGKTYLTPTLAGEVIGALRQGAEVEGEPPTRLTPRQREVLQLLAEGRSAKEIATILGISARTVEFHKYQMMESLKVHNSAELVYVAIKDGIVTV